MCKIMKKIPKILIANLFLVVFLVFSTPSINNNSSVNNLKTQEEVGQVWMTGTGDLEGVDEFDIDIYLNSGTSLVAAYGIILEWDPNIIQISGGVDGVNEGADGFIMAENVNNTGGRVFVAGFDAMGAPASEEFHLLIITMTRINYGTTELNLTVESLVNESTNPIGLVEGLNSSITLFPAADPILSHPPNISFEEGETGNIITWTATDASPDEYTITVDGSVDETDTWTSGSVFTYNVDDLLEGTHTVVIEVTDELGHSTSDTVIVEVTKDDTTTTTTTSTTSDTTTPTDSDGLPGYDILIFMISLGLITLAMIYIKRKRM